MNIQVNEYAHRMWSDELHRFDVERIEIRESDGASRLAGVLRADTPDALKIQPRPLRRKSIAVPAAALEIRAPDENASHERGDARQSRDERARWSDLFHKYEDRHRCHPYEIHDADDEEDAHQRPAAAQAVRTVLNPHA